MRAYNRCWHLVRVPKVFAYILMCDCRLLLDTSASCFEIESVWSNSINVNITLNSDPYFLGSTGNRWSLCDSLALARICPQLLFWHQLSLPTDCFVQCGMKTTAEQRRVHVRLLFWRHVELLRACKRCQALLYLINGCVRYKHLKSESEYIWALNNAYEITLQLKCVFFFSIYCKPLFPIEQWLCTVNRANRENRKIAYCTWH